MARTATLLSRRSCAESRLLPRAHLSVQMPSAFQNKQYNDDEDGPAVSRRQMTPAQVPRGPNTMLPVGEVACASLIRSPANTARSPRHARARSHGAHERRARARAAQYDGQRCASQAQVGTATAAPESTPPHTTPPARGWTK